MIGDEVKKVEKCWFMIRFLKAFPLTLIEKKRQNERKGITLWIMYSVR